MTPPNAAEDRVRFEGNFLDANDIRATGKDFCLEIASVVGPNTERDATKKLIDKWIVGFKGAKKRLIVNNLNAKIIVQWHGEKSREWIGKKITLTVRWLKAAFGEKNVPVIRVVPRSDGDLTFGMRRNYGQAFPFDQQPN